CGFCPATPLAKEAKGRLRPKSLGSAECVRSLPLFPDFSLGRSRAVRARRIRRSGGSRLNPDAGARMLSRFMRAAFRPDTLLQARMRLASTPGVPADRE